MGRSFANRGKHARRGPEVARLGAGEWETARRGSGVHPGGPGKSRPLDGAAEWEIIHRGLDCTPGAQCDPGTLLGDHADCRYRMDGRAL